MLIAETRNTFIELHEPITKKIDPKSAIFPIFVKEMNELLRKDSEVKAITEYIFTFSELEEKGVELSYNQCVALKAAHILDIDIDVPLDVDPTIGH